MYMVTPSSLVHWVINTTLQGTPTKLPHVKQINITVVHHDQLFFVHGVDSSPVLHGSHSQ